MQKNQTVFCLGSVRLWMLCSLRLVFIGHLMVVGLASVTFAQSRNTQNTLKLDDPASRPAATIESVAWMAGSWKGKAFGGDFEEVWTPPSAGTMVGLFKLMHNAKPTMYEFELIVEDEGSLSLQLKHFNADFSGWEEKDKFVSFPLVKLTDDAAYFDGLTYRRDGPDRLQVYVAITENGKVHEEKLIFLRM